ncbi:unnamed protein product [Closterium sp. NIES-53]
MASLRVLPFDPEGKPVAFDTWHDDLQLYLLSDSKDSVSLFDHVSGAALAPPATADVSTRSQWLSRDATAHLAIRNHQPATESAHFGEHRKAQALYDAVVARYSSPATAALGRLLLPYLFPELSAFATVADLVTHLRTSDARYRATVPAEFLPTNQPPMFITLYFIVTRLPDSLRSARDHFLTLDPTSLTVDLLEQHLLAAETSAVAVGAARGTPRSPFFEGCSPSPLSSSFAFAAAAGVSVPEDVGAASTSTKRRNSKGKGGRGSGGGSGGGGGDSGSGSGGSGRGGGGGGGGGSGGTGGGGGGSGGGGGGSEGSGGSGGGGTSGGRSGPQRGGPGGGRGQQQQRRSETQTPQQLREWLVQRGAGEGSETCPYRTEFGDDVERPRWAELLRSGVAIFDLDFDVMISAMYALSFSGEGDCYWCVPPDPGIAAAALGARASGTPPGTAPAEALHTFTLDSGASRCFFRDSTTLTPLPAPVPIRLADPSGGPVVASSSTVLLCPAVPSGSLSGLHHPSFSTNLVITAALQDAMVTTTTPGGSSLYTLATEPPQVAASAQVSASGQVAASCLCRLLSHQTLLWHHRLGHPSLPRLHGMHSRLLVFGLPRSLPPLPPSPAPPCLPCVEGRQRAAPHSSSFPPMSAPLQTLHMDVWGPARVSGQRRERYFLLVVDDYTRYTTVFPLCSKGEVSAILIPWIRTVRLQLRERFGQDLPVPRLHSDKGGEFSSDLLRDICHGEGILQSFTLPDSPQQNGIAERRIGLVMEVARTSMIHAAAPHFLWPLAVRYAAHQLNLWPRVSLPETSPTLRWTGKVGNASVFRVWGSRAFVRDTSADKLSARAIPCVFLGFVPYAPGWQFYHPTSRRVLPSQDVTFDESVPFYHPLPSQGPAPSGVSQIDPLPGTAPVQVAVVPGAASGGAVSGGAEPGAAGSEGDGSRGAEPEGVEPGGAESEGAEPGGAESEGAESGGSKPRGSASSGGPAGASPRLSSQQLHEWLVQRAHRRSGALGAGEPGDTGAGGAAVTIGAASARGAGPGTVLPRPYFVPLLQQVLGVPSSTGLPPPFLCPQRDKWQPPLQPASPPLVPFPYTEQSGGLIERREPASRPVSPVRTARHAPRSHPPPVPGTHNMALRPSSVPLPVPLPAPPKSSLLEVPDPESDRARAASPTVARLLATAVIDPSFESDAASALVAELLDIAAACRLDYASALEDFECLAVAVPRFASLLLASEVDPDAPDIPTPRSYAEAITGPYSLVPGSHGCRDGILERDYELHSLDFSTAFLQGSLHEEIWLHQPPGFTGSFPAGTQWSLRRPVYGLRQAPCEWHDTLRTTLAALGFVPSTADPSPFLRTDTSLPPFYVLVYVDDLVFATADTEALTLVKFELQKRHSCTDLGELRIYLGLQITRDKARRTITLTQSHMSVEPSGPYLELVGCLITSGMGLVLGGQGPVVLTAHADASWVDDSATQRSSQGYTFSLGSGSVSWWSTRSSSVLSSSCEAEIYAGAMAAQELRWLTYFLTDLGEQPHSPPVLYVDNKAMIALCQEHRLEHRTKHIALRYILARELQQRGQLCLAYVATRANSADVFTKALLPGDHQRFVTVLGFVPTLPHLLTA